ncbi:MAG: hypothetical protein EGS70_00580 [Clostridiales bacterium]|nr:hypothetical protein [Clostridiales bacterium]
MFYIHGGGFIVASVRERRAVCQYITANYGYNCVTFNYPTALHRKICGLPLWRGA